MTEHVKKLLRTIGAAGEFGVLKLNHEGASMRRLERAGLIRARWHMAPNGSKEMLIITEAGKRELAKLNNGS